MSNRLADILVSLDMSTDGGLVFTDSSVNLTDPSEILATDQARRFGAKAVYFRRIQETQVSIPQVYIYDTPFDDDQLTDLHRKLWSSGVVPFFYIITDTEIKIFSCTRKAERDKVDGRLTVNPFKTFSLASQIIENYNREKFSAKLFDNGSFWQQEEFIHLLDPKNGPYETLLQGLIEARKNLSNQAGKHQISMQTISKLLIMCILVKYLEEKTDENGTKLFSIDRDFWGKYNRDTFITERFTDILRHGQAVEFFQDLSEKFSGEVFQFSEQEKGELQKADLNFVADVFDAKVSNSGQYVFWDLYSFNYLPIELISGIYEAFLNYGQSKKNKGVVYTPPYLVNFLIDECMPLAKAEEYFSDGSFKILDPACGSGIFLVSAFKRLIQWSAVIQYKKIGEIKYPDLERVKEIIRNNIFGVDVEQEATRLTIFSLCIAICEKLSPMQILRDLRFDDLSQNIRTRNFFAYFNDEDGLPRHSFDLVIGNPPFNPPTGISNKQYYEQLLKEYPVQPSAPIHDNNLAIHFLDRCMRFPKIGKKTCLILPSGAWLYNNNSLGYRTHFFKTHTVNKIIDFTHLSDVLFYGRANIAVCAVIAQNATPIVKDSILHVVVHRAKVAERRYYFELDHYDFNRVKYHVALNSPYVWKTNLLGGGRLLNLVERLTKINNIENFLLKKKENEGWAFGEGYIVGRKGPEAEWITGMQTVITGSFTENGIKETSTENATSFYRSASKNKLIFAPPHVLIKENLGRTKIPISYREDYLCFKDKVIGIYAPVEDSEDLKKFYNKFLSSSPLYRFFLISTSGQAGISMSSSVLLKTDIMRLPFEMVDDLLLSPNEEIIREDVIKYLLKLSKKADTSPLFKAVTTNQIKDFARVFCTAMNPIYESYSQNWQTDSYIINERFVGVAFCYGKPKTEPIVDWNYEGNKSIYNLIYNQTQRNVRITRVLRAYLHVDGYDILIFIKPNLLRYWLKSVALRDTDETFADLKRAGF